MIVWNIFLWAYNHTSQEHLIYLLKSWNNETVLSYVNDQQTWPTSLAHGFDAWEWPTSLIHKFTHKNGPRVGPASLTHKNCPRELPIKVSHENDPRKWTPSLTHEKTHELDLGEWFTRIIYENDPRVIYCPMRPEKKCNNKRYF